jgi:two-component system, LytTR family, sensor kinase
MIPSIVRLAAELGQDPRDREHRVLLAQLGRAKVQILQLQHQPQFLLRALTAISGLLATDIAAAHAMLGALADVLRASLEQVDGHDVPLRDELVLLASYLDFERARFRDRLVVRTDVSADALEAHVPRLLLQPLVENAIRRVVERTAELGVVEVTAAREGNELHVGVRDDASGALVRVIMPFRTNAAA